MFQSTLPSEERPFNTMLRAAGCGFNPRSPPKGDDTARCRPSVNVSIRSPSEEEATKSASGGQTKQPRFNPPPKGAAASLRRASVRQERFQSRSPRKERSASFYDAGMGVGFNPRSPRKELATPSRAGECGTRFQSTLPSRKATRRERLVGVMGPPVSIPLPSERRATVSGLRCCGCDSGFNPRSSERERLDQARLDRFAGFNPRSPRKRATIGMRDCANSF